MYFLKMLKGKTSPLKRARKSYFLKLWHIELAMAMGTFTLKFGDDVLEQVNQGII